MNRRPNSFRCHILGIAALLLFVASMAQADVAVVIQGSVAVSSSLALPAAARAQMESLLNYTAYYHGHSVRMENARISSIADSTTGKTMLVDKATRTYQIVSVNPLDIQGTLQRIFGSSVNLTASAKQLKSITYHGRRCRQYYELERMYFPATHVTVFVQISELRATDFSGVDGPTMRFGNTRISGVPVFGRATITSPKASLVMQCEAVSFSTRKLSPATFRLGAGYIQNATLEESSSSLGPKFEISGLMSARAADPYASLNESTGAAKALAMIKGGRYNEAADLVRELDRRGLSGGLGSIYNTLGDQAMGLRSRDKAWGWYSLTVANSKDSAALTYAYFALEKYYVAEGNPDSAAKMLKAVIDLPVASPEAKSQATELLTHINPLHSQ